MTTAKTLPTPAVPMIEKHVVRVNTPPSTLRYRCSLNSKLCRLGIGRPQYYASFGTLQEIKVFGFWGEYGRKAET